MNSIVRETRSVCPVCLKNLPAQLIKNDAGEIHIERSCPEHGTFSACVWRGKFDFDRWTKYTSPLDGSGTHCPGNCGICAEHEEATCCCLLEVTARCNLKCKFCFANGGEAAEDPSADEVKAWIRDIVRLCGKPLLQFSGGEPTLRDDLDKLIRYAKEAGCSFVQLNTNGIRLAQDKDYVRRLKEAGLDIVFLQFDGVDDGVYTSLRGMPLFKTKVQAIKNCAEKKIGVTLVPTVVRGVNDDALGDIIAFAKENVPAVRAVHFQPVSYFGRYPTRPDDSARYTLDELMADISRQAGITQECFIPSRCDHPLCGFHSSFLVDKKGELNPLATASDKARSCADENRTYVARHWMRHPQSANPAADFAEEMDFETFLNRVRSESLTLSAMAFQDAMNLNIERLHRCSLHVYKDGTVKPFCANYLTPIE